MRRGEAGGDRRKKKSLFVGFRRRHFEGEEREKSRKGTKGYYLPAAYNPNRKGKTIRSDPFSTRKELRRKGALKNGKGI